MKQNSKKRRKRIIAMFLLVTFCLSDLFPVYADGAEDAIEIETTADFLKFAENCRVDAYSLGKIVELRADIHLSGTSFTGVPYFNGIFHGNGYTISGINIEEKGSQIGLFRYIGESGVVSNLNAAGAVVPTGSQEEIGGIAGVNYGTIQKCYFEGTVCGVETVGAIAGRNQSSGQILNCSSNALVMATDNTGGVAGVNNGIIDDCINKSRINIEELETELDLGGIDLGTLNLTQRVVSRNNTGGIAGKSTGVISNCRNYGEIGFAHTGYNVGGIAGSQSGVLFGCSNDGMIYGRKDIGGIVGQAEPYVESEYLSEQIEQTKKDVDRMHRTLTGISDSLKSTSEEAAEYADALVEQYTAASDGFSERLEQMENAISDENKEAKECMRKIADAQTRIREILEENRDGDFSEEEKAALDEQQRIIEENTKRLDEIYQEKTPDSESMKDSLTGNRKETDNTNLNGLLDSVQSGMDTITNGIDSISRQAKATADHFYENTAVLRGEKELITDVSSIKNAATMDGVIHTCINRGIIEGDLNVGGIAGTMNIEYDEDPEADFNLSEDVDIATSSIINDVMISCINYGKINGKKNHIGSIIGFQEFGYIYDCEGYGDVKTSAGSYIGGIAGKSSGTIEKSYSIADLSGGDYIGGIAGKGESVIGCLSIAKVDTEGERIGGIAGYLEEGGTVERNYFVKDGYDGIDNISYLGVAEPKAYEELMQLADVPSGFKRVRVTYEAEGETIFERMIPYGSSLLKEDFPLLVDREDAYVQWPEASEYTNIKNNITIEAEYIPWNQSVASQEQIEEKPLFLAAGHFYDYTKIKLTPTEVPVAAEGQQVLYAYDWTLVSEREKEYKMIEGHFYIPKEHREQTIEVWTEKEGNWIPVKTEWDGSYMTAELPYEAAFAVIEIKTDNTNGYLAAGAAALVLLLVISGVIVHNKRKKNTKKGR